MPIQRIETEHNRFTVVRHYTVEEHYQDIKTSASLEHAKTFSLRRSMLPQGSLGHEVFPESLEGRRRPVDQFAQPLSDMVKVNYNYAYSSTTTIVQQDLIPVFNPNEMRELFGLDINTFVQLLFAAGELNSFSKPLREGIRKKTFQYLNDYIAIGPDGRFLEAVTGQKAALIPGHLEIDRQQAIAEVIGELPPKDMRVIKLRFGLEDGIERRMSDIGSQEGLTRNKVGGLLTHLYHALRSPENIAYLNMFYALPENSLGKRIWWDEDIDYGRQVAQKYPDLDFRTLRIGDLNLDSETLKRLPDKGLFYRIEKKQRYLLADFLYLTVRSVDNEALLDLRLALRGMQDDTSRRIASVLSVRIRKFRSL